MFIEFLFLFYLCFFFLAKKKINERISRALATNSNQEEKNAESQNAGKSNWLAGWRCAFNRALPNGINRLTVVCRLLSSNNVDATILSRSLSPSLLPGFST